MPTKLTPYKKKSLKEIQSRNIIPVSTTEKNSVQTILNKFIELFKIKHL